MTNKAALTAAFFFYIIRYFEIRYFEDLTVLVKSLFLQAAKGNFLDLVSYPDITVYIDGLENTGS